MYLLVVTLLTSLCCSCCLCLCCFCKPIGLWGSKSWTWTCYKTTKIAPCLNKIYSIDQWYLYWSAIFLASTKQWLGKEVGPISWRRCNPVVEGAFGEFLHPNETLAGACRQKGSSWWLMWHLVHTRSRGHWDMALSFTLLLEYSIIINLHYLWVGGGVGRLLKGLRGFAFLLNNNENISVGCNYYNDFPSSTLHVTRGVKAAQESSSIWRW